MSRSGSSGNDRKSRRTVKGKSTTKQIGTGTLLAATAAAAVPAQTSAKADAPVPAQPQADRLPKEALAQEAAPREEQQPGAEALSSEPRPEAGDAIAGAGAAERAQPEIEETSLAAEGGIPAAESEPAPLAGEQIQLAQASPQKPAASGGEAKGSAGEAKGGGAEGGAAGAEGGIAAGYGPIAVAGGLGLALAGGGGGAAGAAVAAGPGGFVAKGPLAGASVGYDTNGNGILDASEVLATTNADGTYTFPAGTVAPAGAKLLATGGSYTGKDGNAVAFTGTLAAPAGGAAITPFSTLQASGINPTVLSEILGGRGPADLTLGDFDATDALEALGVALFEQLNAGVSIDDIIDNLEAADATLDFSDPNAVESIINLGDSDVDAAELARIDFAAARGAVANFDSAGDFTHYSIKESNLSQLQSFGADPFGAGAGANAGDLWVEAEGTILGTAGAPIAASDLNALGVDHVVGDELAPYLRLLNGNLDANPAFTASAGGQGVVGGTELNGTEEGYATGLGADTNVSDSTLNSYLNNADWDDPLNTLDDQD